ncbi:MAG: RICIN domain-containing protein, partial [Oscillospiraceae bacterium]|nr:RICIN domain-containing protein [Oscillospiraceae bacterium]
MKKIKSLVISMVMTLALLLGVIPQGIVNETVSAASLSYPAQAINFAAYTTNRNLNLSGTSLNTQVASGAVTENWRINYVSAGVYNIISMSNDSYLTAGTNSLSTASANSGTSQQWKIEGVQKDCEGYYLYYKITSVATGQALTYYQSSNTVSVTSYTGDGAQKWKLNSYGAQGFAANCKISAGEKACTIGGVLGKTVYVDTVDELESALDSADPATVVLSANLDMKSAGFTRIRDNKTLVGSYSKKTLQDCQLRTNNEYGTAGDNPSDNIVIFNIDFQAVNVEDKILLQIWSSRQIWIDHCTFNSKLNRNKDEVGKFIWLNTPYDSYMDAKDNGRSPDFITISYCTFTNRYWTVAYGTQNTETTRCRTSVMYNKWDNCARRCPQIGNGIGHIYNNYHTFTSNDPS